MKRIIGGMESCPKCGTWRRRGMELVIHINVCQHIRCPGCGMPRHPQTTHYCTAAEYEAAKAQRQA